MTLRLMYRGALAVQQRTQRCGHHVVFESSCRSGFRRGVCSMPIVGVTGMLTAGAAGVPVPLTIYTSPGGMSLKQWGGRPWLVILRRHGSKARRSGTMSE